MKIIQASMMALGALATASFVPVGLAVADEPFELNAPQMDVVTAGTSTTPPESFLTIELGNVTIIGSKVIQTRGHVTGTIGIVKGGINVELSTPGTTIELPIE